MRVLVTGATGQVGASIVERAPRFGVEPVASTRETLDITDSAAVAACIKRVAPAAVINAAAYTAVDAAEDDEQFASAVNVSGPGHLAAACARVRIPLLHLSTDYVFDGTLERPYREDDPASPINAYGRTKWKGEQAVRQTLEQHLILRVSAVFSPYGRNFVQAILQRLLAGEELRVVVDQRTCPTPAADIADVISRLLVACTDESRQRWGTYHYCGTPAVTWYEFAAAITELASNLRPSVRARFIAIEARAYAARARRPQHSVLDCDRIARVFQIKQCPWREGLSAAVDRTLGAAL